MAAAIVSKKKQAEVLRFPSEQFRALGQFCFALNGGEILDGDNVLVGAMGLAEGLAAELEGPKPDACKIANVADALATALRFVSESSEYRTSDGAALNEQQRDAIESCGVLAQIAAKLCRQAAGKGESR